MIRSSYQNLRETKVLVHILVCVFAIASWANINGMWVELPLLVLEAPEQWTLPSFITIISQLANIGPLLFVLITFFLPRTKGKIELYTSGGIIILSVVSSFLIAFFWDKTSHIAGDEHSTALLILNFFMAFGDCISSVSFYAFMSMMKPEYMASLFIGEGLSGMLPAMIALGQGAGDIVCVTNTSTNATSPVFETPSFSVKVYFILLSCILMSSFIAFILLNVLTYCRTEFSHFSSTDQEKKITNSYDSLSPITVTVKTEAEDYHPIPDVSPTLNYERISGGESSHILITESNSNLDWKFLSFQAIVVLINMSLTSFLSSIQIYSTLPYGLSTYHLATTLTQIANPVACIVTLIMMMESLLAIFVLTLLGEVCVAYIIYMAAMSPDPPLHEDAVGGDLSITIWVIMTFLLIYAKVCIAGVMRNRGRNSLILTGVSTQLGSFIGAVIGFLLVNHYHVFVTAPYC